MHVVTAVLGISLVIVILWDVFETIILPRRITRKFRLARMFYRSTWRPWSGVARCMRPSNRRETFLSFFRTAFAAFLVCVVGGGTDFCFRDSASGEWIGD